MTDITRTIGKWSVPDDVGNLRPSGSGFVECYVFYKPGYLQFVVPECSQLAKTDILFGPITTTDFNGKIGDVTGAHEYGSTECNGSTSGFSSQSKQITVYNMTANGLLINRGIVSQLDY